MTEQEALARIVPPGRRRPIPNLPSLASRFGISASHVKAIITGKFWRHVL